MKQLSSLLFKKPFYGKSLSSNERLDLMCTFVEKTMNIEGDLIECGVYRGGSLIKIAQKLKESKSEKILYGLDTFEGHPYSDLGTKHIKGYFRDTSYRKIKVLLALKGLNNVTLIKGKFIDTFSSLENKTFCFANVDCDLYESTKQCLEFLMLRMPKDSILWFDDYNSKDAFKANEAIEEFINKNDLIILPKKQAYYIKR